jgi:hypothetical protein
MNTIKKQRWAAKNKLIGGEISVVHEQVTSLK